MVKTIQVSEKTYAKLYELKNNKIQYLSKQGKFMNPGFEDIIADLLEFQEAQLK